MHSEQHPGPIAVRYAVLVGFVTLVAVPVYVFVEPPWRGLVMRLASALVLGVAILELRGTLARALTEIGRSPLDDARAPAVTRPDVPPRFLALIDDVRAAVRSRRYFEQGLWPRLVALASPPPARPAPRSLGRGPSLASLRNVIAAIEKQP
jgi:hypothetical protein